MRVSSSRAYNRPPPVPRMPPGLVELMEGLSREVLKNNPPDVFEFCAKHMEKLLELRDGPPRTKPLTLEQKIAKAQEKVRQRAKERQERFDKEFQLHSSKDLAHTSDEQKTVTNDGVTIQDPIFPSLKTLVHHEQDLEHASEISHTKQANETLSNNSPKPVEFVALENNIHEEVSKDLEEAKNVSVADKIIDDKPENSTIVEKEIEDNNIILKEHETNGTVVEENKILEKVLGEVPNVVISKEHETIENIVEGTAESHLQTITETSNESLFENNEVLPELTKTNEVSTSDSTDVKGSQSDKIDEVPETAKLDAPEHTEIVQSQPGDNFEKVELYVDDVKVLVNNHSINQKMHSTGNIITEMADIVNKKENCGDENLNELLNEESHNNINKPFEEQNAECSGIDTGESLGVVNIQISINDDTIEVTHYTDVVNSDEAINNESKCDDNVINQEQAPNEAHEEQNKETSDTAMDISLTEEKPFDGVLYASESTSSDETRDATKIAETSEVSSADLSNNTIITDLKSVTIEKELIESQENTPTNEENINVQYNSCKTALLSMSDSTGNDNLSNVESESSKANDDSTQNNINNTNNMDLETAAITIQKVFRSFMFKSRNSTFDDTAHAENNSLDIDDDSDKKDEYYTAANMNKERRPLGITRMDTVLQTVNEEKSLSLSTDDSSTISSAATTIQAHVRGFLVRNRMNSNKTSMNSLVNSHEVFETDTEQKNKTVLNIHIVPEQGNYLSRDESLMTSMDLSLDSSPPSSINLHPLSNDISERRKMLKREDAIQSISPPSNNSGKLSEDSVKEVLINDNDVLESEPTDYKTSEDQTNDLDNDASDLLSDSSVTPITEILVCKSEEPIVSSKETVEALEHNEISSIKVNSDEADVITPYVPSPRPGSENCKLIHSGEFHDVALPTKVSRNDTSVVRGE